RSAESNRPARLRRVEGVIPEDRLEQAREALVEVGSTQGLEALAALHSRLDDPGFAQDAEVVREGRLRETEVEAAAGPFVPGGEPPRYLQSGRIAQRVQHVGELELGTG